MKGQEAKTKVIKKISDSFGDKYIGEFDKKLYVWSEEDGAPIQVCLSLTVPKNPVATDAAVPEEKIEFTQEVPTVQGAEISEKEKQLAEDLLKRLGL